MQILKYRVVFFINILIADKLGFVVTVFCFKGNRLCSCLEPCSPALYCCTRIITC